jgi:hypothetical protein
MLDIRHQWLLTGIVDRNQPATMFRCLPIAHESVFPRLRGGVRKFGTSCAEIWKWEVATGCAEKARRCPTATSGWHPMGA